MDWAVIETAKRLTHTNNVSWIRCQVFQISLCFVSLNHNYLPLRAMNPKSFILNSKFSYYGRVNNIPCYGDFRGINLCYAEVCRLVWYRITRDTVPRETRETCASIWALHDGEQNKQQLISLYGPNLSIQYHVEAQMRCRCKWDRVPLGSAESVSR